MRVKLLLILLTLIIPFSSFGKEKMEPLFDLNEATIKKLEPEIYSTKKKEISGIFDIPIDNAIASNSVPGTNAITLITFEKDKVKYKTIIKNFKKYVSGGTTHYLPIFSEDWIGYSQSRGFNLINIKKKKAHYYSLAGNFNFRIGSIGILDEKNKIFCFNISSYDKKESDIVQILDLKTNNIKSISEKKIDDVFITVSNKKIFTYRKNQIKAYDMNLNEVGHPLINIYEEKKELFKNIKSLIVHPFLPFAVFSDYENVGTWVVSWRKNDTSDDGGQIIKLFSAKSFLYQFTYDHKWFVFKCKTGGHGEYMVMPCGEEYPNFFGEPILLGDVPEFPSGWGTTAVTRNPAGFVIPGTDDYGDSYWLKKWDFTKAEELIEKE